MLNGHLQLNLRSVLLPNKVKMNTFTNNLPFVEDKQTRPRFLESPVFFHLFLPWETTWHSAFVPSVPKRVQGWRVSWIRFIKKNYLRHWLPVFKQERYNCKKNWLCYLQRTHTKTTFSKNFECYCQIRFMALCVLQTSKEFWVFLFRQSS